MTYKINAVHIIYDTKKELNTSIIVCIESNPNGNCKAYYFERKDIVQFDNDLFQRVARNGKKFYAEHAKKIFPFYKFEE